MKITSLRKIAYAIGFRQSFARDDDSQERESPAYETQRGLFDCDNLKDNTAAGYF